MASIGIMEQCSAHRSMMLAEQLQRAHNSRVVSEQAKGILAERRGVDMNAAFDALRGHARQHGLKLSDFAWPSTGGTSPRTPSRWDRARRG